MLFIKWIGALLIASACGGFAIKMKFSYQKEVNTLKKLIRVLDYMECELQYRIPALTDLLRISAEEADGSIRAVFLELAQQLDKQIYPDVKGCMKEILQTYSAVPQNTKTALQLMADSLGKFDLNGQLKGLQSVRQECRSKLSILTDHGQSQIRSYQILGICGGAALVIILM